MVDPERRRRVLVLGGGGVTGIAWELGLIEAWVDGGVDPRDCDVAIGTSAGSAVVAQLWSGEAIDALVARQLDEATKELLPSVDLDAVIEIFEKTADLGLPPEERCARVGALALAAPTVAEAVRQEIVAARLPSHDWPDHPIRVTAVDAASGAFVVFDRTSGVPLVDAVAASCAVPGVWPPVTIGDRRYLDGGVWSPTNAWLASGYERVLVVSPLASNLAPTARSEVNGLRDAGAKVLLVEADDRAQAEMGANPLDPAKRPAAVAAGRRQGQATLDAVSALWTA